jgi:MoaA/NifB/PqqE/SkfB family radical SAM enzyme
MLDDHSYTALDQAKFRDPLTTAKGESRASVALAHPHTVWFNTGTLCNLTCVNYYIESSPTNDRLAYITAAEVAAYLDEIASEDMPVEEIDFTGGEPFTNPEFMEMVELSLARGFEALILTNAMKPMAHKKAQLLALQEKYNDRLHLRVSIDHHTVDGHEELRGPRSWGPKIDGLKWLAENGFDIAAAGRTRWDEDEAGRGKPMAICSPARGSPSMPMT